MSEPAVSQPAVTLADVEVDGERVDVTVVGDRVAAVDVSGGPIRADQVVDGEGVALLPGLHDHHLHLLAMAAARASVDLDPRSVRDTAGLVRALHTAADDGGEDWVRAVGYHESVAGELDAAGLDRLVPTGRPVRVQHRTGACWILNGAALARLDLDGAPAAGVERDAAGRPTGRLFGLDDWLRTRLPRRPPDLAAVGRSLAACGITGVTDATPSTNPDDLEPLAAAVATGFAARVVVTGGPSLPVTAGPGLARGPVKLVVGDHALPSVEELVAGMRAARRQGRTVAVHCVTVVGLVLALTAWDEVGVVPGDRVEHGAVVPLELVDLLRGWGLTVVTQPAFVIARGDEYLADVDPVDRPDLWRCGSLLGAGVRVGGSSDAPYGPLDPWEAIRAAVERTTASGRPLGPDEAIGAAAALDLYLAPLDDPGGEARRIVPGAPADLCLLDRPLAMALGAPEEVAVLATMSAGRWTHGFG